MLLNVNLFTAAFFPAVDNGHGKFMLNGTPRKNLVLIASCPFQNTVHIPSCITLKPKDGPGYLDDLHSHCVSSHFEFDSSWQLYHLFIINC